jgi:hypothetical protein
VRRHEAAVVFLSTNSLMLEQKGKPGSTQTRPLPRTDPKVIDDLR